jgi:hypothetical protein
MKRTAMPAGKGFKPRTTPMKSAAFARVASKEGQAVAKLRTTGQREAKTAKKSRPKSTAAERAHMAAVAAMGCCLCEHLGLGATRPEVHHVRARHGWGRSGHFATIPLCRTHHRGQPGGVHDMGREQFTALYGVSEIELLERVTLRLISGKAASNELAAIPKQISLEQ